MLRPCIATLAMAVILLGGCGSSPVVTPGPAATTVIPSANPVPSAEAPSGAAGSPPAAASSSDPAVAAVVAHALAHGGQPGDPVDDQVQLLDAMGIRGSLGADADQILALLVGTENAARSKQAAQAPRPRFVTAAFKQVPNLYREEFGGLMAGAVGLIGEAGDNPTTQDLGTRTVTQTEGGRTATATIHGTAIFSSHGSDATLDLSSEVDNTVTDIGSGQPVLTETKTTHMVGELDGCPSTTGLVPAALEVTLDARASTFAGPGGGVASSATGTSVASSKFQGTSDDTATLGAVNQSYTHHETFHHSAAGDTTDGELTFTATGIDNGVPAERGFGAFIGGWSGATTDATRSGDVTDQMFGPMDTNAGFDFATMNTAYMQAQAIWRDTRCVIVTAPSYIPTSAFAHNAKPTHTEEVDKSSSTEFDVGLDHRYGQTVTPVKITTALNGKESLKPEEIPKPPGTLTFVAPDEDGQDSIVTLTATSRQGIAKLFLTFHTGAKKFQVDIHGTLTTSGFGVSYTATVSLPKVVLELQPDGTYRGTGNLTATMKINGDVPCPTPFKERGTVILTARRPVAEVARQGQANPVLDETAPREWKVTYDTGSKVVDSGSCLGMSLGQLLQLGPEGMTGPFMTALLGPGTDAAYGDLTFKPDGGTVTVKRTVAIGPSQNKINATVAAKVISESGR